MFTAKLATARGRKKPVMIIDKDKYANFLSMQQ
jgi:hypothetical protein